ncbi:sensor histidine kinase [Aquimarina sp. 2201CG5-10]|uniref:sensor histidine kinase n=1 Tax=Aquimarina callyspongiae TaxID=3098150 RepID=UPI002AB3CD82|nr:histidine kinase [Aquimarina sp. 2201CG5-10]MDY8135920.1 histidine kinase [Aquimarina sp. 2201CG5-10]
MESFTEVTAKDMIIRTISLFALSYLILQLNSNWKNSYAKYGKWIRSSITIVLNVTIFLVMVKLFATLYPVFVKAKISEKEIGLIYFVYFVVVIFALFIARILTYQILQQQQLLENERLKQQNLQKELTALKNQINPHFLFNSLNSLNSIVRENKEATTFVNKLSYMYRYILQSGDIDLVSLKEELKFLQSYIHLIKTRYRDRFDVKITIEDSFLTYEIPPLAIQLLVENAVKHNEISEGNPLLVKIYSEDEGIYVENKIQPRTAFVDSTGNGLMNLDKRYFLLKKNHISIQKNNNIFKVKLPLN